MPSFPSGTKKNSILKKGHFKTLQFIPHLIMLLSLEPLRIKDDQYSHALASIEIKGLTCGQIAD